MLPLSTTNAIIVAIATMLLKIGPTAGQKYFRCEFSTAEMTEPAPYMTTWMAKKRKKNVAAVTTAGGLPSGHPERLRPDERGGEQRADDGDRRPGPAPSG